MNDIVLLEKLSRWATELEGSQHAYGDAVVLREAIAEIREKTITDKQLTAAHRMLVLLRELRDHFGYDFPQWQELDDVIEDAELVFATGETNDQR
jgi:hypothetical protein